MPQLGTREGEVMGLSRAAAACWCVQRGVHVSSPIHSLMDPTCQRLCCQSPSGLYSRDRLRRRGGKPKWWQSGREDWGWRREDEVRMKWGVVGKPSRLARV